MHSVSKLGIAILLHLLVQLKCLEIEDEKTSLDLTCNDKCFIKMGYCLHQFADYKACESFRQYCAASCQKEQPRSIVFKR